MGGRKTVKAVYLTKAQQKQLEAVALEIYQTMDRFIEAVKEKGREMNHPDYWMAVHRVPKYLNGRAVNPLPAREMFAALGDDPRVSFLEVIGSQRLKSENRSKRGAIEYEQFARKIR